MRQPVDLHRFHLVSTMPRRYLGVVVVLGIGDCDYPSYDQTVCQTLDGDTRLYTMPFSRDDTPAHANRKVAGNMAAAVRLAPVPSRNKTMWQLSFPATEQEGRRLRGHH